MGFFGRKQVAERKSAGAASDSFAEEISADVQSCLSSLDRASNVIQSRKRAAALASALNTVEGEASVLVLDVVRREKATARLLQLLDEALDEADDDDDDSEDDTEADTVLAASLLSCLASLTFIGGVRELQAAGGVLQLLKLMRFHVDDGTVRSYAAACLQNASSFVKLFDPNMLTVDEEAELERLVSDADASIAAPARHVHENIVQIRRHNVGELDVSTLTATLEKANADSGPRLLTANLDSRWWEHTTSIGQMLPPPPPGPPPVLEQRAIEVDLRMGDSGFGLRLAPVIPPPTIAPDVTPPPTATASAAPEPEPAEEESPTEPAAAPSTAETPAPATEAPAIAAAEAPAMAPAEAPAMEFAGAPAMAPSAAPVSDDAASNRGVLVTKINPGSPNATVVELGDEIIVVAGTPVLGVSAHATALGLIKAHAAATPKLPLRITVLRQVDPEVLRREAAAREVERLAEEERNFPWKGVHKELVDLEHRTLQIVDPEEAARFAQLIEGTPWPIKEVDEEAEEDTAGGTNGQDTGQTAGAPSATATHSPPPNSPPPTASSQSSAASPPRASPTRNALATVHQKRFGGPLAEGVSLSVQAAQRKVDEAWQRALRLKVRVALAGTTVELTGGQVMGLHAHAFRATSHQVAVKDGVGERVVLTLAALTILKERIEAKTLHAAEEDLKRLREHALNGALAAPVDASGVATECAFTFLAADKVRGCLTDGMRALPSLHELRESHPDWLVERSLSLDDACTGVHARSILAVSHRWESRMLPDPEGVQLQAIVEHLEANPQIELVWMDHACTPLYAPPEEGAAYTTRPPLLRPPASKKALRRAARLADTVSEASAPDEASPAGTAPSSRASSRSDAGSRSGISSRGGRSSASGSTTAEDPDDEERQELERLVAFAALPFLCCECLLLVDSGFHTRFWTSFEAWLSMQTCTPEGFASSALRPRCKVRLLRDEPGFMENLTIESWRVHACRQACDELGAEGLVVTWPADKQRQLTRLLRLDEWLRSRPPHAAQLLAGTDNEPDGALTARTRI